MVVQQHDSVHERFACYPEAVGDQDRPVVVGKFKRRFEKRDHDLHRVRCDPDHLSFDRVRCVFTDVGNPNVFNIHRQQVSSIINK